MSTRREGVEEGMGPGLRGFCLLNTQGPVQFGLHHVLAPRVELFLVLTGSQASAGGTGGPGEEASRRGPS